MRVAMIGGTGFVGSYITDFLLAADHEVRLLVRTGSEKKVRQPDRITSVAGELASPDALEELLEGCDAVIYNVGILRETRGVTFESSQFDGVVKTVNAAMGAGVKRLLLMSANGAKCPGTRYQETKRRAEEFAWKSELDVTVVQPSVIFGNPRGTMEFATQLCNEMVHAPFPAVSFYSGHDPDKGAVVMSPVHVEDVASAFVVTLENDNTIGETLTLGGPQVLKWSEMVARIASAVGKNKWMLPMPIWAMRVGATLFDGLPFFPVTRDQLTMLEEGNTVDPEILRRLIGREPLPFDVENLSYLGNRESRSEHAV